MLRAVVWKLTKRPATATIVAAWVGRALAIALLVIPFYSGRLAGGDMISTVWVAVIAAFMWIGAGQSIRATKFRERLPELQARRLARRAISVSASTPLAEAIRQADESRARAWIDAGSMARSIEPSMVLPADLSGMALLEAIKRAPASEYLLVEPSGQVYGVLAAKDLDSVFAGV
jgi:hypothetical protein